MTQIFVKYKLHLCIFRHLKLEIALAIPASNDEKIELLHQYIWILACTPAWKLKG